MKIELMKATIREVARNYVDNDEEGVLGYGGRLNIRPAYQREFVYKIEPYEALHDSMALSMQVVDF